VRAGRCWAPLSALAVVGALLGGYVLAVRATGRPPPHAAPRSCPVPVDGAGTMPGATPGSDVTPGPDGGPGARSVSAGWTGAWGAAQQWLTEPPEGASGSVSSFRTGFQGRTVRLLIHPTVGGDRARIRLANTFGNRPLRIDGAAIGLAVSSRSAGLADTPDGARRLTFAGSAGVVLPPGRRVTSDPVTLPVRFGDTIAVDVALSPGPAPTVTGHARSVQTSFVAAGDRVGRPGAGPFTEAVSSWFWLEGVDVRAGRGAGAVIALGDSLTDGTYTTTGANRRWPDRLAERLQRAPARPLGVINEGIGGNRVVSANPTCVTPSSSALDRFDRDVLGQAGARTVVVAVGINDVAIGTPPQEVLAGLRMLVARSRAHGLRVLVATLTPFRCARGCLAPAQEEARQRINRWVRTTGDTDGVVDFDRAVRDPARPSQLHPAFDLGDHLHLNDAGQAALAAAVPVDRL
jgi:lysophospholipase L1-like esterase